ncbi:type VII secretion protein EccB [Mycobacterium servetii]|uniref:Type VII secretion protein EccB n=1 Tax=Mycobacterium servetii TaxID=3237418 RepID=A0ABV4C9C1_9MYCO
MTTKVPPGYERQGFKSRSAIQRPAAVRSRPWGFVTKHQISGWRFLIRRISNGVALQDTGMITDPLRRQGRALSIGGLVGVVVLCGGALLLHILKPAGVSGTHPILAERSSNALYVVVNNELHPVLNLTSARLIVGKPDDPTGVKSNEIDKFPLGNTLGIPGAPSRMVQSPVRDARWVACDSVAGAAPGVTMIVGDPVPGAGHASPLGDSSAVLASRGDGTTWLIWGNKRSQIDLTNAAVSAALGINTDTPPPRPINRQVLNMIPESPPLTVPFIANAGDPPQFVWPAPGAAPVIGAVVVDHEGDQVRHYAVTIQGLQPISPVIAAILRADNAHGLVDPPVLTPDQVAKAPSVHPIPVEDYPAQPLTVLDPGIDPVICGQWVKLDGAPTSTLTLLVGQSLPVAADAAPVSLAGGGPGAAARVVMPKGRGYFVQVTGQQPKSMTKESLFWLSDLGVRYGLESTPNETAAPAKALGLANPLPVPWSVLSLFAAGPPLSKADALIAH